MGALANAALLMNDPNMEALAKAAVIFQASNVIVEPDTVANHAQRRQLAIQVLNDPNFILGNVVNLLSATSAIATQSGLPGQLTEKSITDRVAEIWTTLATLVFPQGG